jgi:hypothetical protein
MPGTDSRGMLAVSGRFRVGGEMARSGQDADAPARAIAVEGGTRPGPLRGLAGTGHQA